MTTIRIPGTGELADRLSGLDRLLTATKWERAAIVYAYTQVGEVGRGRFYKPDPPKMHIRTFAEMGLSGLTTNKAVSRYRDAWVGAINNGWAVPVEPGDSVELPDQEFPAWPYGGELSEGEDGRVTVTEDTSNVDRLANHRASYIRRPAEERVLSHLEDAARALGQLADLRDSLDDAMRQQLVQRLTELRRQADTALRELRQLVSV